MTAVIKIPQGAEAWFEMAGSLMSKAVSQASLPSDFDATLVERYTDGIELSPGLIQSIRFDIRGASQPPGSGWVATSAPM